MMQDTFLERRIVKGRGGGKAGSSSGNGAKEAPNTLRSRAIARFIDLVSEGEIGGLVNGDKSVFFNKIQAANEDGTTNFSGFTYKLLTGLSDQPYLEGFEQITSEYNVALRVRQDQAAEWVTNSGVLDGVIVTVNIPALSQQNKQTGDMNGWHIALAIDVRNVSTGGQWVQKVNYDHIQGKNTSPYERSYNIVLDAGPGQYAIRVRRISEDNDNDVSIQDKLYFQRVTEVIDQKMTYADSAVVGVTIDSEQFGTSIPERAYEIYGMKCKYPSNYDPVARTYSGFWNGTWNYGWCNNPAWVFMAMATHPRYGAGINEMYMDKWGLYDLARYCDESVPDGYGGQEPRFVFNGTIASREDAYRVLQGIASMMRAIVFYAAGAVITRQDRPYRNEELVSFTKANVKGVFNYSSTAKRARYTSATAQFVNPKLGYEKDFAFYEDRPAISRYGHNPRDIAAYGTTSRGQAYRLAKWAVLTDLLQTESVQFVAGVDASGCLPGDIIEIADPHLATADFGGRIVSISADGKNIVLDREISFAGATSPELHLTMLTGAMDDVHNPGGPEQTDRPIRRELRHFESTISGYDNVTKTVTLTNPIFEYERGKNVPLIWVFSKEQLKPRLYKVFDIEERSSDGIEFKISAINYSAEKFILMDENFNLESDEDDNYSDLPSTTGCLPPTDLNASFESFYQNGELSIGINIDWQPSQDRFLRGYKVSYRRNMDDWTDLDLVRTTNISIKDALPGQYEITVRAQNQFGAVSQPLSTTISVNGSEATNLDLISNIVTDRGDTMFTGRNINVQWLAKPISRPGNTASFHYRNVRPGVGVIDQVQLPALPGASFSLASAQPGDQLEITVGLDGFYHKVAAGQTADQAAEVLKQMIDLNPYYASTRTNGSDINIVLQNKSDASDISGEYDPYFLRYKIVVRNPVSGNVIRTEYTDTPAYVYTYEMNLLDNTIPQRSVRFDISVEDIRGNYSNTATATLYNPPPTLTVPEVSAGYDGFTLRFATPTDPDYMGTIVWASTTPGVATTNANRKYKAAGNPFVPGLANTTYYYKYAMYDAFTETDIAISSEQSITLPAISAVEFDTTPPAVPTGLGLTSSLSTNAKGEQTVILRAQWTANTEPDLDGYEIGLTPSGSYETVYPVSTVTSFPWNVPANLGFTARIRSVDKTGNRSAWSGNVTHTTATDTTAPTAPTSVAATAYFDSIAITAIAPTAPDTVAIRVYENTTNTSGTATLIATMPARPGVAWSYQRGGVGNGTTRYYWLAAVDSSGNVSVLSSGVSATARGLGTTDFTPGVEPIVTVSALPSTLNYFGRMVRLSSDGKLYTWTSNSVSSGTQYWSATTAASDISGQLTNSQIASIDALKINGTILGTQIGANEIKTGNIAANAIVGDKIAANAVTASKLYIGDLTNVFRDPNQSETSLWLKNTAPDAIQFRHNATFTGEYAWAIPAHATNTKIMYSPTMSVDPGRDYFFSIMACMNSPANGGAARVLAEWYQYDSSSDTLTYISNQVFANNSTASQIRSTAIIKAPSNASRLRLLYVRDPGGTSNAMFIEPIIRRAAGGELIVDGAITANKILAGTITGDRIQAGTITASLISAQAITVDKLAVTSGDNLMPNGMFISEANGDLPLAWSRFSKTGTDVIRVSIGDTSWPVIKMLELHRQNGGSNELSAFSDPLAIEDSQFYAKGQLMAYPGDEFYVESYVFSSSANIARIEVLGKNQNGSVLGGSSFTLADYAYSSVNQNTVNINTAGFLKSVWTFKYNGGSPAKIGLRFWNLSSTSGQFVLFGNIIMRRRNKGELIVDGALSARHISASSITGDRIAGSTITGNNIAAQTIRVNNLLVVGSNLNPDPSFQDDTFWAPEANGWYKENPDASAGFYTRRYTLWGDHPTHAPGTGRKHVFAGGDFVLRGMVPLSWYRLRARFWNSCNQTVSVVIQYFDINNTYLGGFGVSSAANSGQAVLEGAPVKVPFNTYWYRYVIYNDAPGSNFTGAVSVGEIELVQASDGKMVVDGSIKANHIEVGSLTGDRLAANTITGVQIAAQSITTRNLAIGNFNNVIPDGDYQDPQWWKRGGGSGATVSRIELPDGNWSQPSGLVFSANDSGDVYSEFFAVEPGATYRVTYRVWKNDSGATGFFAPFIHMPGYMWLNLKKSGVAGTAIGGNPGYDSDNSEVFFGGTDTGDMSFMMTIPSNVQKRIQFRFRQSATVGNVIFQCRIVRVTDGTLIQDGSITTNKIAANQITADKMSVNSLSAISANLGSITGGSLNINNRFVVDASGNVTISSASTGARLTISNTLIQVYDANNVLRVRMGLW